MMAAAAARARALLDAVDAHCAHEIGATAHYGNVAPTGELEALREACACLGRVLRERPGTARWVEVHAASMAAKCGLPGAGR